MNVFFEFLISQLEELKLFVIIKSYQQGVLYKAGVASKTLTSSNGLRRTGLHFKLPYLWEVSKWAVTYRQEDLPVQSYVTKDDRDVSFSANIGYTIEDALLVECNLQDWTATLSRVAMGWLATKVNRFNYDTVRRSKTRLETALVEALQPMFRKWGIEVHDVRLTDFTRSKQHRHYLEGL